jgi:hypothetical protein
MTCIGKKDKSGCKTCRGGGYVRVTCPTCRGTGRKK